MSWLTTSSSSVLELKESIELLQVLGALKSKLNGLESKNVIDILDLLIQDEAEHEAKIQQALNQLGNQQVTDLVARWKELRTKLDDPRVKKLRSLSRTFQELGSSHTNLPKIIDWRIFTFDENKTKVPNEHIKLSLSAGASASIDMEANANLPALPADVVQPSAEKAVFRFGVDGNMMMGANLTATGGPLSVGIGGSATGKVDADFYFLDEQDARFGVAAAENISALVGCDNGPCSPLNIGHMQSLIEKEGLYCVKLTADSKLQFNASVGVGQSFDTGGKVKAKLGIAVGYTAIETGMFDYLLTQHQSDAEDAIAIQLKRSNQEEKTISESFRLDFDISDLAKHLQEVMDEHFGDAKEAIDELKDLLPGSDFIRGKLEAVVDEKLEDTTNKEQIKTLLGFIPGKTPETVLRDKIVGALEGKSETWANEGEKAVNAVLGEVTRELPRLAEFVPEIREAITAAIKEKREQLVAKITEKVTSANGYKKLAEKLNKAGAAIPKTISNPDKRIEEASKAAEDLLNKVQGVINKAESLLKAAAEKKITLRLFSERKSVSKEGLDLRFDVFPARSGAQEAVDAILLGDMGKVIEIIKGHATDPAAAPIKGISGDYQLFEKLTTTAGSEIVLFDLKLGAKSIIDAEVDWRVDVAGNISVISRAEFKRINEGRGESRTVRIVESSEMLFASKKNSMTLGITVSHEDDDLKVSEATGFLSRLIERGLLPGSAATGASSLMASLGDKQATKGRIDVGITFTKAQIDALISHVVAMRTEEPCVVNVQSKTEMPCELPSVSCHDETSHPGCGVMLDTTAEILADVLEAQYEDDEIDRIKLLVKAHELTSVKNAIKVMTPQGVKKYSKEWEFDAVQRTLSRRFNTEFGHFAGLNLLEYRRYGALAVYEMLAHIKALLETEFTNGPDAEVIDWTAKTLRAQQYRIGQVMSSWWQWDREWKQPLFLSDKMRALNVALFETLVILGQTPTGNKPTVWATISLPDPASGALIPKKLVAG